VLALNKPPGLAPATHWDLYKLLRRLRPTILHTYNLAAVEYAATAMLAGVPVRVHAEHGRDASDPDGKNWKHNLLRRLLVPVIDCFVPVSADLQGWLGRAAGVPQAKNLLIDNGVDTSIFAPATAGSKPAGWPDFAGCFVIGTVGRIQDVKDHAGLVDAFAALRAQLPRERDRLRLVIVGDGPLRAKLAEKVRAMGLQDVVHLPGARRDIADLMRTFSVFAMSSIAEGTPVVLLEAMACGLPVVATRVGGIPAVVEEGTTGALVPARDPSALAAALARYALAPELVRKHGAAARRRIENKYSIGAMLASYLGLYDRLAQTKTKTHKKVIEPCAE
jgi:sugar transferase (PEP-CTERM/EpsH1 system associated)